MRMDRAVNIVFRMPHESVIEAFRAERVIRPMLIGTDMGAFLHRILDDLVYRLHPLFGNDMGTDFALTSAVAVPTIRKRLSFQRRQCDRETSRLVGPCAYSAQGHRCRFHPLQPSRRPRPSSQTSLAS